MPKTVERDRKLQAKVQAVKPAVAVRYQPPKLEVLGDLRDLTLGGSPGSNDSGTPTAFNPQH